MINRLRRWLGLRPPAPYHSHPGGSTGPPPRHTPPLRRVLPPPSAQWVWLSYESQTYGSAELRANPLVILVIADLMGDADKPAGESPEEALLTLTDNDPGLLLRTLRPQLTLQVSTDPPTSVTLRFETMADFTPAGLARQVGSPALVAAVRRHPDFQHLRERWHGLACLADAAGTDGLVVIRVLPTSLASLHRDWLADTTDAGQHPLATLLRHAGPWCYQAPPISLVVADYRFEESPGHGAILTRLVGIGADLCAPVLAEVGPALLGLSRWADFSTLDTTALDSLRRSADTRFLGLVAAGDGSVTGISGAHAVATLVVRAFRREGWTVRVSGERWGVLDPPATGGADEGAAPAIIDADPRRLADLGLMAITRCDGADAPTLCSDPTLQAPGRSEVRLGVLLACCRVAHYLQCSRRDRLGAFQEREDVERELNDWLGQLIHPAPDEVSPDGAFEQPLRSATLTVSECMGNPGYYLGRLEIQPLLHAGATQPLTLDVEIPIDPIFS